MEEGLIISELQNSDAAALSSLLCAQPRSYLQFFTPFAFEYENISRLLEARRKDAWLGLKWNGVLIGFFMLRGWDDGYEVPAYGGMVDLSFTGSGLGRLSLRIAKSIARLRQAPRLMLKVHPKNLAAKALFEKVGFKLTGPDPLSSGLIYHFELPRRSARP